MTFIRLPLPISVPGAASLPASRKSFAIGGGSQPLAVLVEHDDRAADLGRQLLEGLGYRALVAASEEDAMRICSNAAGIALVIVAWARSRIERRRFARAVRQLNRNISVFAGGRRLI